MVNTQTKILREYGGYTIVETMVFLAVTATLLIAALGMFNGQQERTRFTQGLREMDAQIRAVATEVETGYYPNSGSFRCRIASGQPGLVTTLPNQQGENEGCTFLGKTVQFGLNKAGCAPGVSTNCDQYVMHTVFGRQIETDRKEVQTLHDPDGTGSGLYGAQPRLAVGTVDLSDTRNIPGSMRVYGMFEIRGGGSIINQIGSVGFFYPLGAYESGSSDPISGSKSVDMIAIRGTTLGQSKPEDAADIAAIETSGSVQKNPDQIVVCFTQAGGPANARKGAVVLGGQGRQLTTQVINDVSGGKSPNGVCGA